MELNVIGASPIAVSEAIFGAEYREHLIHQVVVAYQAGGRAGTKAQLTRGQMSGSTRKFKKQKGGGARHGDYRAPIFVGGGRAFAASPRDHSQKVNRKMFRGAIRSIFAELNRQGRLKVVSDLTLDSPKTRDFLVRLHDLNVSGYTLLVNHDANKNLFLAVRNIPLVNVLDVTALNPVALVRADQVILTAATVKKVEEWLV